MFSNPNEDKKISTFDQIRREYDLENVFKKRKAAVEDLLKHKIAAPKEPELAPSSTGVQIKAPQVIPNDNRLDQDVKPSTNDHIITKPKSIHVNDNVRSVSIPKLDNAEIEAIILDAEKSNLQTKPLLDEEIEEFIRDIEKRYGVLTNEEQTDEKILIAKPCVKPKIADQNIRKEDDTLKLAVDEITYPLATVQKVSNIEPTAILSEIVTIRDTDPTLRYLIEEFYQVQRIFHDNMAKVVKILEENPPPRFQAREKVFQQMLQPFKILARNPFNDKSCGNDVEDITHIMQVINQQNVKFREALYAMTEVIANADFARNVMMEIIKNNQSMEAIQKELGCNNWKVVCGYLDQPRQNLFRYILILESIQRQLHKTTTVETIDKLHRFTQSIKAFTLEPLQEFKTKVNSIDYNRNFITILTRAEYALRILLSLDYVKKEQKLQNINFTLTHRIDAVLDCIFTGKKNIIEGRQDIDLLCKVCVEFFQEIIAENDALLKKHRANMSYLSYARNLVSATLFSSDTTTTINPQLELQDVIKELNDAQFIDAARDLEEKKQQEIIKKKTL